MYIYIGKGWWKIFQKGGGTHEGGDYLKKWGDRLSYTMKLQNSAWLETKNHPKGVNEMTVLQPKNTFYCTTV